MRSLQSARLPLSTGVHRRCFFGLRLIGHSGIRRLPRSPFVSKVAKASSSIAQDQNQFSQQVDDDDILHIPDIRSSLSAQESPFIRNNNAGGGFIGDRDLVTLRTVLFESPDSAGFKDEDAMEARSIPNWCIRAGPRETVYFNPQHVTAAIVTCGGLCPGLNDVVQNIVFTLLDYGVSEENILGIRYGLRGFYSAERKPMPLSRQFVSDIHLRGGTILGTSRGGADMKEIVHRIDLWGLNMVFVIGGNGGNAAANAMHEECRAQNVNCCVVGVPKSIDNDILLIDRCFGFETAVAEAQNALLAAKVEARSAYRGIGLVNVMGRQSGFIAMQASMASGIVDCCLIPEINFSIDKVNSHIESIIEGKGHCVICVAEGAGQEMLEYSATERDASGNPILGDIGQYLGNSIKRHFKERQQPVDLKYIDPTYMIRAIATIPSDHIYCKVLGQNAVHAAFSGYTGLTTGMLNTHHVYLPIPTVIKQARQVNIQGRKWNRLKTSIAQPDLE
eukprot:jgi/Ulvmu1/5155/UM021_0172.1